MSVLGIDVGGSSVKGALLVGDKWKTAQSKGYASPDRAALVFAVRSVAEQLGGDPACVGMCVPGKQSSGGECVECSANLPVLNGWAFKELFAACGLGSEPRVYSDAIAAGADFVRTHGLNGRAVCISMGTGVGLGVFEDGRSTGLVDCGAEHFGMVEVGDGKTLESVVGIPALREGLGDDICAGVAAMGADDPVIGAVVRMVRVVCELYFPEHVVLMGGIGIGLTQHTLMIDRLVREDWVGDSGWELRFGDSMFHAAMGAARLARGGCGL